MNNFLRGLLSGYGAWKLGGGCLGTIENALKDLTVNNKK